MKAIKQIAYEKYKLDWMKEHGYSIEDLIRAVVDYQEEVLEAPLETYWAWEHDSGFGGEIWVCYNEFLETEYCNSSYMMQLLTEREFTDYQKDIRRYE